MKPVVSAKAWTVKERLVGRTHEVHTEYSDDKSPTVSLKCFCPHDSMENRKK